jgi:modification methylase
MSKDDDAILLQGFVLPSLPEPYYEKDGIAIYHGDCTKLLGRMPDSSFDCVFTSPPYNLGVSPYGQFGHWKDGDNRGGRDAWKGVEDSGVEYGPHTDSMPYDQYRSWQSKILSQCWRITKKTGAIFYVHKPRPQRETLLTPLELSCGLPLRQIVIWDRGSGFNRVPTWYVPSHEWILVIAGADFRITSRNVDDVWRIPPEKGSEHPAPFPVALPARAIGSFDCGSVLDPFMGSGTTLVAASEYGIRAIGIEINERYCEIAAKRLSQGTLF